MSSPLHNAYLSGHSPTRLSLCASVSKPLFRPGHRPVIFVAVAMDEYGIKDDRPLMAALWDFQELETPDIKLRRLWEVNFIHHNDPLLSDLRTLWYIRRWCLIPRKPQDPPREHRELLVASESLESRFYMDDRDAHLLNE